MYNNFDRDASMWEKFVKSRGLSAFNDKLETQIQNMDKIEGKSAQNGMTVVQFFSQNTLNQIWRKVKELNKTLIAYYLKHDHDLAGVPTFRMRKDDKAWHVTLWGVLYPQDFQCRDAQEIEALVQSLLKTQQKYTMRLSGFGFMGFGGLALRGSQPDGLQSIRRQLEKFCYPCSKERYFDIKTGNSYDYIANKAMIGQLRPPVDEFGVDALTYAFEESKKWTITYEVKRVALVTYKNVYLDKTARILMIGLAPDEKKAREREMENHNFLIKRSQRIAARRCLETNEDCLALAKYLSPFITFN